MVSTTQNTMGTGTMCKWMNKGIKKGHRCDPIFVNLKSNTMKNTGAKVRFFLETTKYFEEKFAKKIKKGYLWLRRRYSRSKILK